MSTEEYHKAKNTGIADTSKFGVGLGLAEYHKKQAAHFEKMKANQTQIAGSRALGERLGLGFANLFYYLGPVIFLFIASVDLGEYLSFGESPDDYPDWYKVTAFLGCFAVPIAARLISKRLYSGLVISLFLYIGYKIFS